jgi:hypothetical protein|tara:strand:+ start:619 stop:861 length:243 start_codon:yes stop_codon:yes gene_type:complete
MTDNQTASANTEGDISTEELVNRYNTIVGEFNKQRKMIDKLAIQVAKHTVEITERDVVIDTLRSMITPQQEQQAFKSEEE